MEPELKEIPAEDLALQVGFALSHKAPRRLQVRDDQDRATMARAVLVQLQLCGVRFFKKPLEPHSIPPTGLPGRHE